MPPKKFYPMVKRLQKTSRQVTLAPNAAVTATPHKLNAKALFYPSSTDQRFFLVGSLAFLPDTLRTLVAALAFSGFVE